MSADRVKKSIYVTAVIDSKIRQLVQRSELPEATILRTALLHGLDRLDSGEHNPFVRKKVPDTAS